MFFRSVSRAQPDTFSKGPFSLMDQELNLWIHTIIEYVEFTLKHLSLGDRCPHMYLFRVLGPRGQMSMDKKQG